MPTEKLPGLVPKSKQKAPMNPVLLASFSIVSVTQDGIVSSNVNEIFAVWAVLQTVPETVAKQVVIVN